MCDIINKFKIYVTMIAQNDMRYEITHRHQRTHLTKKKKNLVATLVFGQYMHTSRTLRHLKCVKNRSNSFPKIDIKPKMRPPTHPPKTKTKKIWVLTLISSNCWTKHVLTRLFFFFF